MDNLTHTLVGVGMANAFFRKRVGPEAVPILAWSSNLPDIDAIVMLSSDPAAITWRRTFGHSVFLFPIWSAALAWLFKKKYPQQGYARLLGLCLLGSSVHVFFDLVNSFGVRLLWPFWAWRPELASVFIVDLILLGLLAAPLLAARFLNRENLARYSRFSMTGVAAYLLFCFANRALASSELAQATAVEPKEFSYVFPEPLGPHRWRGVNLHENLYKLYLIHSLTGRVDLREEERTTPNDPRVLQTRQTPLGRSLDAFFKAPVWLCSEGEVAAYDIRFRSLVFPRRGFEFRFHLDPAGRLEASHKL
ncbi:MAG: metal-dependent hydrolase [Elusimicrobia bacterium]|nr:metal-dependent hydrolase [Elusimicrobiota bacterium]